MRKIVDFGISESSKIGRLMSGHEKLDLVNGTGDYLGIVRLGNKNLLFTRTTRSGRGKYDGQVMINEIDFDLYPDGEVVAYYNLYKTDGIIDLQRAFNNPTVIKMLDEGKSLLEILDKLKVRYERSHITKAIESDFMPGEEYHYPKDYDFAKALMPGSDYNRDDEITKERVERLIITGIDREIFEDLLETKKNAHHSFYDMACSQREKGINR